jgi:NAD(P)-dependent dehydrogenase (short-subunit alcohol dehydrogenase family)
MNDNESRVLAGQAAVVTGGGHGIGAAIAGRLARLGAEVVICGRDRKALGQTAAQIAARAGRCEAVECDVTEWKSVFALAERVEQSFGRLDILVNNAGIGGYGGDIYKMPLEAWDRIFHTNLRGVFYCIRALAPLMITAQSGHIVNISSLAGKNPLPGGAAYAASKWGLNGFSYSVAEELRRHNIRVSVVCPGSVHTDFAQHGGKDTSKMLEPDDVAQVVAMLVTQAPRSFVSEVLIRPTQKP